MIQQPEEQRQHLLRNHRHPTQQLSIGRRANRTGKERKGGLHMFDILTAVQTRREEQELARNKRDKLNKTANR